MSVFDLLKSKRIFSVKHKLDANTLRFKEQCDQYFTVELTIEQVKELLDGFQRLHDAMSEVAREAKP